jgi:hypothetical protein
LLDTARDSGTNCRVYMQQKPIKTVPQALSLSDVVIGSAKRWEIEIGVTRNTGTMVAIERRSLVDKHNEYTQARREMRRRIEESQRMFDVALGVILPTRDVLKVHLGIHHSPIWQMIGFKGSMRMPRTWLGVITVLDGFISHLKRNPTQQVQELNVTPTHLQEVLDVAKAAYKGAILYKGTLGELKKERDRRFIVLRNRLRGLFKELSLILDPHDERFVAYGFLKPGARQRPEIPENVTVVAEGPATMAVTWDRAERADRYRIWAKGSGADEEPKLVATCKDRLFIFRNLPPNAEMELAVSAINNKGESRRSEGVRVKTPKAEDPNPKIQDPEKSQTPNSKPETPSS